MNLIKLTPRKTLNKAFLKVKPARSAIECFKNNLIKLIDQIDESESEEFHKNIVSIFLRETYYGSNYYINTKGRNDLVIHNGKDTKSTVGVIIEAKKPANKTEMLTVENLNTKAFQEMVLYYLRERITVKNIEIKYLIATDIYEWFIFDAAVFEKNFAHNKHLVKQFIDFEEERLSGKTTDFFYKEIAEPAISEIKSDITFTHFDIREYEKPIRNTDKKDDTALVALYKLLSPEHLLKLPFANDSNSLDKTFYTELLHIIGLAETKEGGKKLIQRKKEGERDTGSFIESAIIQLESHDKISRLKNCDQFGETYQERLFNVALELSITWINRILFLKLLEAQQINYHKGDKSYAFLNSEKVINFDDLDSLFFSVLARKQTERSENVKKLFANVPYLNSSLFEPTDIEHACLFISQLKDEKLPIPSFTVLKDASGKKRTGKLNTLEYLFEFLNAYDFSSEGAEEIQEENKTLINASVLGLIFEKINGYKDGSFFTPGFITMYMCRETIRRAVVQKFNGTKGWNCKEMDQLYDKLEDKKEANAIINSLKICDPAVGSGHFLVSALNEIIAIKSELKVLLDRHGKTLRDYQVEVVNDELIITDDDGQLFEYNPRNKESQRIQEALFHEKQTIIENCLFGVDINSNSVKICRLRLWIELLKNAYYTSESNYSELETLPNIDINIKCGNSLISRYALDSDIKKALRKSKWNIESYCLAVMTYRNAKTKEQKRETEKLIEEIKNDFETQLSCGDPRLEKLDKLRGDLHLLTIQTNLFRMSPKEKIEWEAKVKKATAALQKQEKEIEEIKSNKIYNNAFEWRFEFPEVLNDGGDYYGFDIIIGNPPWGVEFGDSSKAYIREKFLIKQGEIESFVLFTELSIYNLLNPCGYFCFIVPNTFSYLEKYLLLRKKILNENEITTIVELEKRMFTDVPDIVPLIIQVKKNKGLSNLIHTYKLLAKKIPSFLIDDKIFIENWIKPEHFMQSVFNTFNPLLGEKVFRLLRKTESNEMLKTKYSVRYGIKTGNNKKFISKILLNKPSNFLKCASSADNISRYKIQWQGDYLNYCSELSGYTKEPVLIPKLLVQYIRKISLHERLIVAIDADGEYVPLNNFSFITTKGEIGELYCLLGLLNSTLMNFYYKHVYIDYNIKPKYLEMLPIALGTEKQKELLINKVDKILSAKKSSPNTDTTVLEKEIDQMVYKLYGLTEDEIRIVEGE